MSQDHQVLPLPPTQLPSEYIHISPEALEVANCYLQCQDVREVAEQLAVGVDIVTQILAKREVRAYIDHVFMDTGFNNRVKMRSAMDAIIRKKFQEMEEAQTGSNKDIIEILSLSHKMRMEELDRQIKLEQIRVEKVAPHNQVNVQINDSGGSNYDKLLSRLMEAK
jgi:hypothetical protein